MKVDLRAGELAMGLRSLLGAGGVGESAPLGRFAGHAGSDLLRLAERALAVESGRAGGWDAAPSLLRAVKWLLAVNLDLADRVAVDSLGLRGLAMILGILGAQDGPLDDLRPWLSATLPIAADIKDVGLELVA